MNVLHHAHFSKLLRDRQIRPTYQRMRILEMLHQKGGHLTADEIYQNLVGELPTLSRVTIYNTLHLFREHNLLRVVDIDEKEVRYDVRLDNHGHFQCCVCGQIYNFEVNVDLLGMQGLENFTISQKNVYFRGICPRCIQSDTTTKGG